MGARLSLAPERQSGAESMGGQYFKSVSSDLSSVPDRILNFEEKDGQDIVFAPKSSWSFLEIFVSIITDISNNFHIPGTLR